MATAATRSYPYDVGSATESAWREMFTAANEAAVTPGTGRQVLVATSGAWVAGEYGAFDSQVGLSLSTNGTANPRYDLVVMRNNFTANQVELDIVSGPAAVTPIVPTPTVNASMHEIPLAAVYCASGF